MFRIYVCLHNIFIGIWYLSHKRGFSLDKRDLRTANESRILQGLKFLHWSAQLLQYSVANIKCSKKSQSKLRKIYIFFFLAKFWIMGTRVRIILSFPSVLMLEKNIFWHAHDILFTSAMIKKTGKNTKQMFSSQIVQFILLSYILIYLLYCLY